MAMWSKLNKAHWVKFEGKLVCLFNKASSNNESTYRSLIIPEVNEINFEMEQPICKL